MSGDSSEEKNHPASAKKLRDSRKKGQIAKAPDLNTAITTIALIGFVWTGAGWMSAQLQGLLLTAGKVAALGFGDAARELVPAAAQTLAMVAAPALAVAVLSAVFAGMLTNKGLLFAIEPLAPKLKSVNPLEGFKRIFGLKSWIELAKSLVKAALLGSALFFVWRTSVGVIVGVPTCAPGCFAPVVADTLRPLLAVAIGVYLASGLLDVLVQKWLFLREMKMTLTEVKRENKDTNGNPHVKGAQRRIQHELGRDGPKIGLRHATLMICGKAGVVGLHFVRGRTPLPEVVCRASGARAAEMLAAARAGAVPLYWDDALAADLAAAIRPGNPITSRFFQQVTTALFMSGAI